jgi:dienelactone hydrolase
MARIDTHVRQVARRFLEPPRGRQRFAKLGHPCQNDAHRRRDRGGAILARIGAYRIMAERLVEYAHDGVVLEGYFAWDENRAEPRPGVLVSHAWGGRGDAECETARRLAERGYCGFALDLYGKGVNGSSREENAKLMKPFLDDRAKLQQRMRAALETLRGQTEVDAARTAAMGYCFGGLCVLDLARTGSDVRGVVSVHGLFVPPANTAGTKIRAKVLALHGYDDPMAPPETVTALATELTEAGADWQVHMYGRTMHAFTNPQANDPAFGTVYNADAAGRAWTTLESFLEETLA